MSHRSGLEAEPALRLVVDPIGQILDAALAKSEALALAVAADKDGAAALDGLGARGAVDKVVLEVLALLELRVANDAEAEELGVVPEGDEVLGGVLVVLALVGGLGAWGGEGGAGQGEEGEDSGELHFDGGLWKT